MNVKRKILKPFILSLFLFLMSSQEAEANCTANLYLAGYIPASCDIWVEPLLTGGAQAFDLSGTGAPLATATTIATIHVHTNVAGGYEVYAESENGGQLMGPAPATTTGINYTLGFVSNTVCGTFATGFASGFAPPTIASASPVKVFESNASTTCGAAPFEDLVDLQLQIPAAAPAGSTAGTYHDYVRFTVVTL